ncbi:MAG: GAF domain-containing protein [Opitutus sp.]|nr:GAF domain-containing protein [Opitutus sp.]
MPAAPQPVPASPDLPQILILLMERVTEFLQVERSTLFLFDEEKNELWTPVAQGSGEIRIPLGHGIAAHVFESGETVRIGDAYADSRFNSKVDRQTGFRTRDIFCRPISDSQGRRIGVIQLLNRQAGPMNPRDETLLDAICGQAGIEIENAQLFLHLRKVHDSERSLHVELATKHAELQMAFLKIEESAAAQELLGRRIQKVRWISMLTAVALFLAIGLFAWLGGRRGARAIRPEPAARSIAWHTVKPAHVRTGVALLGNIEPLEVRNLTAPLRGRLVEKNFQYGELVQKDQLLARIDTTEVGVELRNAEGAHFRATAEFSRLENWIKSPEVARAQRALLKARLSFEANKRNLTEMEQLSKLGIIAQASLDSARQQFASQEADFTSAQEELANVLAVASDDRLTVARYEVENSRLRVKELSDKISHASIHAPFASIVILPSTRPSAGRPSGHDGFYEQGSTINQADILLALGNLEGFSVKARADEVDIARLSHGQPVIITGDAFAGYTLHGQVAYISSQAITSGARPYFEIQVKTGTHAPAERAVVRLGMTARLDITVYDAPAALVVPVGAIRRAPNGAVVFRRGADGRTESVPVTLGATQPDAVEIRSGLQPGDVIAANAKSVVP